MKSQRRPRPKRRQVGILFQYSAKKDTTRPGTLSRDHAAVCGTFVQSYTPGEPIHTATITSTVAQKRGGRALGCIVDRFREEFSEGFQPLFEGCNCCFQVLAAHGQNSREDWIGSVVRI